MADRIRGAARIEVFLKNPVWGTSTTDACYLDFQTLTVILELFLTYHSLVMSLRTSNLNTAGETNLIFIPTYIGKWGPFSFREQSEGMKWCHFPSH